MKRLSIIYIISITFSAICIIACKPNKNLIKHLYVNDSQSNVTEIQKDTTGNYKLLNSIFKDSVFMMDMGINYNKSDTILFIDFFKIFNNIHFEKMRKPILYDTIIPIVLLNQLRSCLFIKDIKIEYIVILSVNYKSNNKVIIRFWRPRNNVTIDILITNHKRGKKYKVLGIGQY